MKDDRSVEHALLGAQRRPEHDHRPQLLGGTAHVVNRLERGPEQRVLVEEVVGGVGRQPELREDDQRRVPVVGRPGERRRAFRVVCGVADPHARHRRGDAHVAVAVDRVER